MTNTLKYTALLNEYTELTTMINSLDVERQKIARSLKELEHSSKSSKFAEILFVPVPIRKTADKYNDVIAEHRKIISAANLNKMIEIKYKRQKKSAGKFDKFEEHQLKETLITYESLVEEHEKIMRKKVFKIDERFLGLICEVSRQLKMNYNNIKSFEKFGKQIEYEIRDFIRSIIIKNKIKYDGGCRNSYAILFDNVLNVIDPQSKTSKDTIIKLTTTMIQDMIFDTTDNVKDCDIIQYINYKMCGRQMTSLVSVYNSVVGPKFEADFNIYLNK